MAALAANTEQASAPAWDEPLATVEGMERFYEHLEITLTEIGFLNPAAPRQLMTRLRRLFNRVQVDQMELNILRGVLTGVQNLAWRLRTAGSAQATDTPAAPLREDRQVR